MTKTQPLLAWRTWIARRGLLYPLAASDEAWPAGPGRACCHAGHRAPDPDCRCGWYAVPAEVARTHSDDGRVWGAVLLWGRVIRHQRGVRAEYAAIACLVRGKYSDLDRNLDVYAANYRVPVLTFEQSIALAWQLDAVPLGEVVLS